MQFYSCCCCCSSRYHFLLPIDLLLLKKNENLCKIRMTKQRPEKKTWQKISANKEIKYENSASCQAKANLAKRNNIIVKSLQKTEVLPRQNCSTKEHDKCDTKKNWTSVLFMLTWNSRSYQRSVYDYLIMLIPFLSIILLCFACKIRLFSITAAIHSKQMKIRFDFGHHVMHCLNYISNFSIHISLKWICDFYFNHQRYCCYGYRWFCLDRSHRPLSRWSCIRIWKSYLMAFVLYFLLFISLCGFFSSYYSNGHVLCSQSGCSGHAIERWWWWFWFVSRC